MNPLASYRRWADERLDKWLDRLAFQHWHGSFQHIHDSEAGHTHYEYDIPATGSKPHRPFRLAPVVIVLAILAAIFYGVHRIGDNESVRNDPPASCIFLGGHWNDWDGWQCGVSDSGSADNGASATDQPTPEQTSTPTDPANLTDDCSVSNGHLWLRIYNNSTEALNFQVVSVTYTDDEGNQIEVDTSDVTLSDQIGGSEVENISAPDPQPGTNGTAGVIGDVAAPSGATGCTTDITYTYADAG